MRLASVKGLKGMTITVKKLEGQGAVVGLVAEADKTVGITVLDYDNPKIKLVCVNRKEMTPSRYEEFFNHAVKSIRAGCYSYEDMKKTFFPHGLGPFARQASCAFK